MSIWPIFVAYATLILSAWVFSKWLRAPSVAGRFASLDGIRGYLAFGVFIHHGAVWYFFLHTGKWKEPPSRIYTNLGQVSVALFFMITAFLFWSKLLRGRIEPINWYKLYLSRLLRLVPLYAVTLLIMGFTVAWITRFQLREPIYTLLKEAVSWSSFTIFGAPDINGVEHTFNIVAGVVWTLAYEWLFYVMLPLMSLVIGAATPGRFVAAALVAAACIYFSFHPHLHYLMAFAGGIIAAQFVRFERVCVFATSFGASVLVLLALVSVVIFFPTAMSMLPLAVLSMAFIIIAAGNTCFGVLTWGSSRLVGEITYSVYLIHGIVLFWLFRFLIGFSDGASYSVIMHWFVVCSCIPVLLAISCVTFRYIEAPAMQSMPKMVSWLRELRNWAVG